MSETGTSDGRSSAILCSIARLTATRWSIRGVRWRRTSRSSAERTRLEWTVPTTYGRGRPASARASAARVPTSSARYMWLWTTSGRRSARRAVTTPTAIASSGSSITWTGIPSRAIRRSALPDEREMTVGS